jgi:hypothetical protein
MKIRMFHSLEANDTNWMKEMSSVLWALCTNRNLATRDSPFHLVYRADVVLPPEIYLGSAHVAQFSEADQQEARELDVDLLEEEMNKPLENAKKYQESLKRHYNKKVVPRTLEVGDLVLRMISEPTSTSSPPDGKNHILSFK